VTGKQRRVAPPARAFFVYSVACGMQGSTLRRAGMVESRCAFLIWEVLKLTVEDAKILISTAKIAKIAKGRERSSVFWRLFASFRG
jgi:hypothetical protein